MAHGTVRNQLTLSAAPVPVLRYTQPDGQLVWTMPVSELLLIAEYTTPHGPLLDDYFIEFIARTAGPPIFHTISYYDNGVHTTLGRLSDHWGTAVSALLFAAVDWDSRILWPPELADQPYYDFGAQPPRNLLDRLRSWLLSPPIDLRHTAAVQAYLAPVRGMSAG